jgi:hypothetical protein
MFAKHLGQTKKNYSLVDEVLFRALGIAAYPVEKGVWNLPIFSLIMLYPFSARSLGKLSKSNGSSTFFP